MRNFGKNLARLRQLRGLSQRALADELGAKQQHIAALETGRISPSWKFANLVADYFGVTLDSMTADPKELEPA